MNATHLPILHTGNGWTVTYNGMQVIGGAALRTRRMARYARRVLRTFNWDRISPERLTASAIHELACLKNEAIRSANRAADRPAVVLGRIAA
jgi:hypothetical protein